MKKLVKIILIVVAVLGIMFAEYRYIMTHICPYTGEDNTVHLEIFGQVDEYYAEEWEE
jgi:hypothetical protein